MYLQNDNVLNLHKGSRVLGYNEIELDCLHQLFKTQETHYVIKR